MSKGLGALQDAVGVTATQSAPAAPISKVVFSSKEDKFKALDSVCKALNTQFKTDASLIRLGSKVGIAMPHLPTDIPSVDYGVFGIGGLPKGRVIEIFGPESSGKTTLTLHIIASCQKPAASPRSSTPSTRSTLLGQALGVKLDDLLVSQPDTGEQALEICELLVRSNAVDVIVIDSVAALIPRAEIEGEMGDSHVGLQAR
jgi:recombination protein RecA